MKFMFLKFLRVFILSLTLTSVLGACSNGDEPDHGSNKRTQTLLVYAIASNDLYPNFLVDKQEILMAASQIDMQKFSILLYEVTETADPVLLEVVKDQAGNPVYSQVKEYDRSVYSTDPERISSVIADIRSLRPAENYGLVLWSHATGIDPAPKTSFPLSSPTDNFSGASPLFFGGSECYAFGADRNPAINPSAYGQCNIPDLAKAIPDNMFRYIWFDACYMATIETAYELRNKCNLMVAYPTEVYTPGAPYDLILPPLLRDNPSVLDAAEKFFTYYSVNPEAELRNATVSVIDMSKMGRLVEICRRMYAGSSTPSTYGVQRYTRTGVGPYYDFGQISKLRAENSGNASSVKDFEETIGKCVVLKLATPTDFDRRPISQTDFSGLSTFNFNPASSSSTNLYYPQMEWYKAVFQ